jgi:hypothetical protein
MRKNPIFKSAFVLAALLTARASVGQVVAAPAAAPALAEPVVSVQSLTLGDLADMAREVEFEKQRRALREAKGAAEAKAPIPAPIIKKVKAPPKPITPEGLQVRAIMGVKPDETIRFYTKSGQFEDHRVGESVQGWQIISVVNEWVTLQKGKTTYPLALQSLAVVVEPAEGAGDVAPAVKNAVQAGALPNPNLAAGK